MSDSRPLVLITGGVKRVGLAIGIAAMLAVILVIPLAFRFFAAHNQKSKADQLQQGVYMYWGGAIAIPAVIAARDGSVSSRTIATSFAWVYARTAARTRSGS